MKTCLYWNEVLYEEIHYNLINRLEQNIRIHKQVYRYVKASFKILLNKKLEYT